jgi:uncharacterized integral membrane protein
MPLIRLVLLLFVGLVLLLFYLQNQSTALPLVFLNIQFLNLPLALWVLTAFAAGILTTLVVAGLASLGTAPASQTRRRRPRRPAESVRQSTSQSFYEPPPPREPEPATTASTWQTPPSREPDSRTTWQSDEQFVSDRPTYTDSVADRDERDDWEDASDWFDDDRDNSRSRDWDWEDEPVDRPRRSEDISKERAEYEAEQAKSSSKSDSTYSYGYRDPRGSGVGKTESVVDADYRVIVPPYRSLDDIQDDGARDDFDDRDRRS